MKQNHGDENYERVARELLGEHAMLKIWLPLILLGVFLVVSTCIVFALDYFPPTGAVLAVLTISPMILLYSVGLEIKVLKQVAEEARKNENESEKEL